MRPRGSVGEHSNSHTDKYKSRSQNFTHKNCTTAAPLTMTKKKNKNKNKNKKKKTNNNNDKIARIPIAQSQPSR